jgi:molybdenum-dependent DNA-binding transcriptional regulator ModE
LTRNAVVTPEPQVDQEAGTPEPLDQQDQEGGTRSVPTFYDALRHIPRAWLAKRWGKSESEIKRMRNGHVHPSSKLRDEAMRLIRLYEHEQRAKAEQERREHAHKQKEREARERLAEPLDAIRAMGRIRPPARSSALSDESYADVLAQWRRRVPRSLRNVQGGGIPLEGLCAHLIEQGLYHGDAHDLDAFGEWLTALVEKKRKGAA